jgi:hypothetical protein
MASLAVSVLEENVMCAVYKKRDWNISVSGFYNRKPRRQPMALYASEAKML